jgi:hypothetical protein
MENPLQPYTDNNLEKPASLAPLPALFAEAGPETAYSFVEFFTAGIANDNTRKAYARAAHKFSRCCGEWGLELHNLPPVVLAGYVRGERRT